MHHHSAFIVFDGSIAEGFLSLLFVLAVSVAVLASRWRFISQWIRGHQGRDWPQIEAVIDIVSTVRIVESSEGGDVITYLATLTYFYRNPELQIGEYSRMFYFPGEAETWVASYKGKTVTVHLDPSDPSSSVLRMEDL